MVPEYIIKERKFLNSEHMGSNVQVGEYRIHYYEKGQGEPLILIHTIGQSLFTWHRVIEELSQSFHVFAIDLLGNGYSDKPIEANYSIDNTAEMISNIMEKLHIGKAHICAFSMSSFYALRLAQLFPNRVAKLIIITPGGVTPTMPNFITALENPMTNWLFKWLVNRKLVSNLLDECFFDQTKISQDMINEYYEPFREKSSVKVLTEMLRAFDEEETIQALRDISQETLMIWGIDDKWHELEIAEIFRMSIENVKLAIIRNCGHIVHEEKETKFVNCIKDFISGNEQQVQID